MSLLSGLKKLVRTRGGKIVVGGAAIGLGTIGTAAAQNGQQPAESSGDATDKATAGATPIEVEGEEILVPVDDVLADTLDDEAAGADVEQTVDTPVSPDSPASPDDEVDSPVTAEAADDTPVTPDTPESPDTADSPASPASPESPESP